MISITELMRQQHILSINFHIIYKLLVTTHLEYHHKTPTYIAKLIKPYSSLRVHNLYQIEINTTKESSEVSIVLKLYNIYYRFTIIICNFKNSRILYEHMSRYIINKISRPYCIRLDNIKKSSPKIL